MAAVSEGVPPGDSEVAQLRAEGEQQLRDGLFMDAAKTLHAALNLAPGDEDLPLLIENAMQKAALVGATAVDAPPALVGKVQNFLADAGIGGGRGGDGAAQRHFDYEPMVSFAMEEGLADESADEIYRLWVERKMEGAIDSYDIVQSHLREVPLKVKLRVRTDCLELFCREPPHSGVVQTIPYDAVNRWKKLVDGVEMEFRPASILEKAKKIKLECPQANQCYQSIQNKLHERRQELGLTRTQHFTVLWDRIDETVSHVASGFGNLKQLRLFVEKRAEAERKLAGSVMEMCSGSTGWGQGRSADLLDILSESGKVNAAWALLVEKTKETAHVHQEIADHLHEDLLSDIAEFTEVHEAQFKRCERDAKALQKQLNDAETAVEKSKLGYYRACMDFEQADLILRAAADGGKQPAKSMMKRRDDARSNRDKGQESYETDVARLNVAEQRVKTEVEDVLAYLEQIERQRLEKTKDLIGRYADITMSEMVPMINTQHSELVPVVEEIDAHENLNAFVSKSLKKTPSREAGGHICVPYDLLQHCDPKERTSMHMAEAGGVIKTGQLFSESGMLKKFEKRYATVWPRNFQKLNMVAPQLYLWEGENEQTKPARVLPLHGMVVSLPDKLPKGYHHAFRFGPAKGAGSKGDKAKADTATLAFADGGEMAEWMRHLSEFSSGEATVRLDFFGTSCASLQAMIEQQKETIEEGASRGSSRGAADASCRVPVVLLDAVLALDRLGARKEEGIFRIPGDTADLAALRRRYEEGELCVEDENDVHVWASFLKLWLRELKAPVVQGEDVYEAAMTVAGEHMRRLKEAEAEADSVQGQGQLDMNAMAAAAATAAAATAAAAAVASSELTAPGSEGLEGLESPPAARSTSPVIAEGDEEEEDEEGDEPEPEPENSGIAKAAAAPPPLSPAASDAMDVTGAHDLSMSSMPTPLVRSSSGSSMYGAGATPTPRGRPRNMRRRGSFFAQSTVSLPGGMGAVGPGERVAPEVVEGLSKVTAMLPEENLLVLHHLCSFLRRVDAAASKMTPENLAIVFAPCLFRHPDLMKALANAQKEIVFTRLLLDTLPLPVCPRICLRLCFV